MAWNRYWYAAGDPVNGNDPMGLCAVMIAGITMVPGSNAAWTKEAQKLGADTAYPYDGENAVTSIASVAQQAFTGWNHSTFAAFRAITGAITSNGGKPVDIIAYSGGGGAFAAAWSDLTDWQKSMVGSILYISPGTGGQALPSNGQVTVETGPGGQNYGATIGVDPPPGASIQKTNCLHTDLACFFNNGGSALSQIQADGQCDSPEVYTRTSPFGVPGTGVPAAPPPPPPRLTGGFWWGLPPVIDDPNQCWVSGCSTFRGGAGSQK